MEMKNRQSLIPALLAGAVAAVILLFLQMLLPLRIAGLTGSLIFGFVEGAVAFGGTAFVYYKYIGKRPIKAGLLIITALVASLGKAVVSQLIFTGMLQSGMNLSGLSIINLLIGFLAFSLGMLVLQKLCKDQIPVDFPQQPAGGNSAFAGAAPFSAPQDGQWDLSDKLLAVIKPLLKAPLTAVLCSREELSITTDGNGNYTIIGYVNSQNSYGAMIKTGFRATAVQANGNWQLLNVKLENQAGKNLAASWLIGILITIITFAFFYFIYSSFLF